MVNIQNLSQEIAQTAVRHALMHAAQSQSLTTQVNPTHLEKGKTPATIILQISSTEVVATQTANQETLYHVTLRPFMLLHGNNASPQALNVKPLQMTTTTALLEGELYAALAKTTADSNQFYVQPHLTPLSPELQIKVQWLLQRSITALDQSPTEQFFNLNRASSSTQPLEPSKHDFTAAQKRFQNGSRYFVPLQQMLTQFTVNNPSLKPIASFMQESRSNRVPIEWLSSQNIDFTLKSKLPNWVRYIPEMATKNIHAQNLVLLNDFLTHHDAQTLGTQQKQTPTLEQKQFESLRIWTLTQRQWLEAPQSIIARAQATFNMLSALSPSGSGISSLQAIHHQLLHLWPTYAQGSSAIQQLESHAFQTLLQAGFYQNEKKPKDFLMQIIMKETDLKRQTELIKALLLRTGLANLEEGLQLLIQEATSQESKQLFTLPYGNNTQLSQWLQVKIQNTDDEYTSANNQVKGQQITLDFETAIFGFLRFELQFPRGFFEPMCTSHVWLERSHFLEGFRQYEDELCHHLEKIGLKVSSFSWNPGRPKSSEAPQHQPKFQIDDYV